MQKSVPIQHTRRKIQFPYEIAIPCFQEPTTVLTKALLLCRAYGFPTSKLTLFVESKEREHLFKETIPRKAYGRIVVSSPGVAETYNYILQFYPPGTQLVCMYEDCMWFIEYNTDSPTHGSPLRSLLGVLRQGFDACIRAKTIFWGIYPITDPQYFKKQPVQSQLSYTGPAFWGIQIPFRQLPLVTSATLHHYERILSIYKEYKSIIRLNHIACKYTSRSSGPVLKQEVDLLLEKYPDCISLEGNHLRVHDNSKD